MTSPLVKQRLIPLSVVFVCLIGFGIYVVFSDRDNARTAAGTGQPLAAAGHQSSEETQAQQAYLIAHYGPESTNATQRALVEKVGLSIVSRTTAKDSPRNFRFHLLSDANTINAFALPTGDIYVTTALVNRMRTEGELAAILASEMAHVLSGHWMISDVPLNAPAPAKPLLHFTPEQESAADMGGLKLMSEAGYNPESMLSMFSVLTEAYNKGAQTQFFATHPSSQWRLSNIQQGIKKLYPAGIPAVLSK